MARLQPWFVAPAEQSLEPRSCGGGCVFSVPALCVRRGRLAQSLARWLLQPPLSRSAFCGPGWSGGGEGAGWLPRTAFPAWQLQGWVGLPLLAARGCGCRQRFQEGPTAGVNQAPSRPRPLAQIPRKRASPAAQLLVRKPPPPRLSQSCVPRWLMKALLPRTPPPAQAGALGLRAQVSQRRVGPQLCHQDRLPPGHRDARLPRGDPPGPLLLDPHPRARLPRGGGADQGGVLGYAARCPAWGGALGLLLPLDPSEEAACGRGVSVRLSWWRRRPLESTGELQVCRLRCCHCARDWLSPSVPSCPPTAV